MEKATQFYKSRRFIHGVGLVILALFIWFAAPLISVAGSDIFESIEARLLIICLMLGAYFGNEYLRYFRAKQNNDALMAGMAEEAKAEQANAEKASAEKSAIENSFNTALEAIKNAPTASKNYVYDTPWYVIIGAPGSGKTTLLRNSGLQFHLQDKLGQDTSKGIGGTVNCDWWFTKSAVFLDTAGRFTTQDSNQLADKSGWIRLLDMLKKYRKQRPVNGVFISVSLADLLAWDEQEFEENAMLVKRRIGELSQHLKINFPVYFMFTKSDRVSGFDEFFSDINKAARDQVWGYTFPINEEAKTQFDAAEYTYQFRALIDRLRQQIFTKINKQSDILQRPAIAGFPSQMATLEGRVVHFLNNIFAENPWETPPLLRGVYFTSATQEGSPIDRLLGDNAALLGFDRSKVASTAAKGKSFFIRNLLEEVVFKESQMVGVDKKHANFLRRLQVLSYSAAALVILSFSGLWFYSYTVNLHKLENTQTNLNDMQGAMYRKALMTGARYKEVLPELNLAGQGTQFFAQTNTLERLGLSQAETIQPQSESLYLEALNKKLAPVTGARLGEMLISLIGHDDNALLFDMLKAYLMFAGVSERAEATKNTGWLMTLLEHDWRNQFPGEPALVEQLKQHHEALFDSGYYTYLADKKIVAMARNKLTKLSVSEQVYLNVKQELLQDHSKDLSFSDLTGGQGAEVFESKSRQDLHRFTIPGLFTKQGFYQDFTSQSLTKAKDYLDNYWIIGEHNRSFSDIDLPELQQEMSRLYYRDYIRTWRYLLADITLKKPQDINDGGRLLEQAMVINGPVESLIFNVAAETNLSQPLDDGNNEAIQNTADALGGTTQSVANRVKRIGRATSKFAEQKMPGKPVTDQFRDFHRLVSSSRGQPPIAQLLTNGQRFATEVNQTLFDNFSETAAFEEVSNRLTNKRQSMFSLLSSRQSGLPDDVKRWMNGIRDIGWSLLVERAFSEVNEAWLRDVYAFYDKALSNRYPLNASANAEVELLDFIEFFRPKGVFDSFFEQYLSLFIEQRGATWTTKQLDGQSLPLKREVINQLRSFHQVTELFFDKNTSDPKLNFTLTPVYLDANVARFGLEFGSRSLSYTHGPLLPQQLSWPFAQGNDYSRVIFTPTSADNEDANENVKEVRVTERGPWSLFRLLQKYELKATDQNSTFIIMFDASPYKAEYELRVDSEFNPIGSNLLQRLALPGSL